MLGKTPVLRAALLAPALFLARPGLAEMPRNVPAPAFTLKQPGGQPLALGALRGKVVLLDFWGPS
jgi:hypothetical protein